MNLHAEIVPEASFPADVSLQDLLFGGEVRVYNKKGKHL